LSCAFDADSRRGAGPLDLSAALDQVVDHERGDDKNHRLFIPISLLVVLLQSLLLHGTGFLGVEAGTENDNAVAFFVLAIGTALTLLGLGLVQAATAQGYPRRA
jgi:O-antigen/teichoic acid export membrane protein